MKLTSVFTFLTITIIIAIHCVNAYPIFEPLPVEKRQNSVSKLVAIRNGLLNKYSNVIKTSVRSSSNHQQVQFPASAEKEKKVSSIKLIKDGDTEIFYSTINIGNQDFQVLFDAGSADLWIPDKNCTGSCDGHDKFVPAKSKTFKPEGKEWDIQYGAGYAEGVTGIDNVQIAGITAEKQVFGLADKFESIFPSVWDGIVGLGFDNLNTLDNGAPTPITTLAKQGEIDPVFSFQFTQDGSGGTFTLGGTEKDAYTGDINYTPVIDDSGFWSIKIDDTLVNGKSISLSSATILDTGAPLILMPEEDAQSFFKNIKGAVEKDDGSFTVPCDTKDVASFKLNDGVYQMDLISAKDGNECIASILSGDIGGGWLVGYPFLKRVYSVFDMGKRQFGVATLK